MNSDLQGELGPLDPGLDQLIGALTAGAARGELAGEQAALAMFREHRRSSSGTVLAPGRPAAPATTAAPAAPASGTAGPAGRAARISARWTLRLAGATALTLAGGLTAAGYANALPAPVQHIVHDVLGFAALPDSHHVQHRHTPVHHDAGPAGGPTTSPAAGSPAPSAHTSASPRPSASTSPSPSRQAGLVRLSITPVGKPILAGKPAVIDGRLTKGGHGLPGSKITLLERHSPHAAWHVAATATTNAQGSVAVTSPALITNTA
jgi:hypothetical protein